MNREFIYNDESRKLSINEAESGKYKIEIDDKGYDVTLLSNQDNRIIYLLDGRVYKTDVSSDKTGKINVNYDGIQQIVRDRVMEAAAESAEDGASGPAGNPNELVSDIPGKVVKINVKEGDKVSKGDVLVISEAMKMELSYEALIDGEVEKVLVKAGDQIGTGELLVQLKS